jgi:glycosyltransferase involved in cell wall biosynthesis
MAPGTSGKLSVALVGTRGVPARYGGFETAVEEVGRRLADRGHRVVVYCRTAPGEQEAPPTTHLGMDLVHLPAARKRSLETLSHSALSVGHLLAHRTDAAIVFNAANSPLLPVLRAARIPVATHVDGLEWKRAKWGTTGQRYYRAAEAMAVRWSDALIADAEGIADYYEREFHAPTTLLTYGAPMIDPGDDRLAELGLEPGGFHLVVARFEPENHVDVIVDGYRRSGATKPLVVVGSAPYSDAYTERVHALADGRVRFLGGVWDQRQLDQLYAHCYTYLHGHSVGGTNPSLLRAIGAGAAVLAFDVDFNREVVAEAGRYFADADDVAAVVQAAEADPTGVQRNGARSRELAADYDWDDVAGGYEELARQLAARQFPRRRPSGRRWPQAERQIATVVPFPRRRAAAEPVPDAACGEQSPVAGVGQ